MFRMFPRLYDDKSRHGFLKQEVLFISSSASPGQISIFERKTSGDVRSELTRHREKRHMFQA